MRLTACLNLPAPGRRQCLYVCLDHALAGTCVFAKQSLDAILCGRIGLGLHRLHLLPAPLLPKLRGHFAEFLDRKSLEHLRLLASPTCVGLRYGHVMFYPRGFSWQRASPALGGVLRPLRRRFSTIQADLPTRKRLPPCIGITTIRRLACSCVPPWDQTNMTWYGNVDPFPISYASRPHLRDRLTLS